MLSVHPWCYKQSLWFCICYFRLRLLAIPPCKLLPCLHSLLLGLVPTRPDDALACCPSLDKPGCLRRLEVGGKQADLKTHSSGEAAAKQSRTWEK